ncbi:glycosyltransferase family 2 protein [Candidatus Kuenenbacteria bacterium]|nr:glycosyltransferase family 2 protein [Candidatus Kuenenbacteria bacterium]
MISIIIPVYNNCDNLEKCLTSLAKQTFKDFEVIVVDDGSPEPVGSGIPNSQFPISNLRFFRINHGGAPKARNYGFSQSKGDLILFCDADMELRKDCLEKMKAALDNNPDKSYVYSDFKYGWKTFRFWPFDAGKLKENNYVNTCSLLRRGDFLGFDESLEKFQDWDLWLTLLDAGKGGVYIPEVLSKASTRGGKISNWWPKFIYRVPFLKFKSLERYRKWKEIVKKKHGIKSTNQ